MAVAVEVTRHDGVRDRPDRVSNLRLEGAVAVAQEHRDSARTVVVGGVLVPACHGQVEPPVAAEVPNREGTSDSRRNRLRGLEGAVAVAQEYPHALLVAYGEVGSAVAGEVPGNDEWDRSNRVSDLGLEGAVAVAQQDGTASDVGHGQVEPAVPAEVPYREGTSIPAATVSAGWKVPSPLARSISTPCWSHTARSVRPSPLKSPATMSDGSDPTE